MSRILTPEEQTVRFALMKDIIRNISIFTKNKYMNKGGTALALFYGLDRFSEDIDLHADIDSKTDITKPIITAAKNFGLKDIEMILKKNTDTTQRYMLHFLESGQDETLKIESSFRGEGNFESEIIDNCSVMSISGIISGKCAAFASRKKPRDIYDISFLLSNYPNDFKKDDLINIYNDYSAYGMDNLLQKMEGEISMSNDWIFKDIDCEKVILNLDWMIYSLMQRQNM